MITYKTTIHSKQLYIPLQRLKEDNRGQAWIGGVYIILFAFVLAMICYETYRLQLVVEHTENVIMTSALGSMKQDYKELSVNHNIVLENIPASYTTLCKLTGKNLHLTQSGNHFSGFSRLYHTESSDLILEKVIFYQVYDNTRKVTSVTYTATSDGGNTNNVSSPQVLTYGDAKTPTGLTVSHTGCYVEFRFPLSVCGVAQTVKKGIFVTLEDS